MSSMLIDSSLARQFDRLPPHSVEAEMCVLGAMMLCGDRHDVLAEIRAAVNSGDFFQADHQILFDVMAGLSHRGKPIDAMIVREELIRRQLLEEVGGIEYLAAILGGVPSYANGTQYAYRVRETAVLRRLIAVASDTLREAYAPMEDQTPAEIARRFADRATELAASGLADPVVTLGQAALKVLARRDAPTARRIPTGIRTLDDLTGGLAKSKFTLIGADPRVGKSQLLKQFGLNISATGRAFGLVTVEEDQEKVAENMLANQSGVPNHRIAYGVLDVPTEDMRFPKGEWDRVEGAAVKVAGLPFYIDDAQHKLDDIIAAVERMAMKYKCEVVAVDHLHLITCDAQTREREVSKISKALKAAFKRCNVAGAVACQLNRGQDAKQKPTLRNLRDSGSLEADGDCIMLLYREDVARFAEIGKGYVPTGILEVSIPKNKDGRMGELGLKFDGEHQHVRDLRGDEMPDNVEDPFQ